MANVAMFLIDTRKTPPEGIWVTHPKDGYSIKARPLYPWKSSEIREKSKKNGKINDETHNRLLTDWVVEDWDGINDDKGNKAPCTPENKLLLFENWPSFNLFVQEAGLNLEKKQSEGELKN